MAVGLRRPPQPPTAVDVGGVQVSPEWWRWYHDITVNDASRGAQIDTAQGAADSATSLAYEARMYAAAMPNVPRRVPDALAAALLAAPRARQASSPNYATINALPANPTGTGSTSLVMMGLGLTITPKSTGKLWVAAGGDGVNNTNAGNFSPRIYYGTGTPPINGAAVTGTPLGRLPTLGSGGYVANTFFDFDLDGYAETFVVGTTYWFDLALKTGPGGTTATIFDISYIVKELP